jgi:hypothetical protein
VMACFKDFRIVFESDTRIPERSLKISKIT